MKKLLAIALIGSYACAGIPQELRDKGDEINTLEISFSIHRDATEKNAEEWAQLLDQAANLLEALEAESFDETTWMQLGTTVKAMRELVQNSEILHGNLSLSAHD
ncbi:hypothetical protein JW872_02015 [Candidatus Babeliales bacterium]|nr:hypothetical protein [Candidatus Babeliales bacterium]